MIRKAETLTSIDELNLSKRTRTYYKNLTADELIKCGRMDAYDYEKHGSFTTKSSGELVGVLKEAGFIRPASDFTMYFNVAGLYKAIYAGGKWQDEIITNLGGFTNEEYENFTSLRDWELEWLEDVLDWILSEKEYEIICFRYGLTNGAIQALETTGRHFNIKGERVRELEAKGMRKLRRCKYSLPPMILEPGGFYKTLDNTKEELYLLHQDPIFEKESELESVIEEMSKSPFKRAKPPIKPKEVTLDQLNLPNIISFPLKRAGVKTLQDVQNFPKEDWFKISYVRKKRLEEVEEKVKRFDPDFSIFS